MNAPEEKCGRHAGSVLLAVRDPAMAVALDDLLADHGFHPVAADSPHRVPDLCAASRFDVLLLDMDLPECAAGSLPERLVAMRPANPHMGVILLATLPPPTELLEKLPRLRNVLAKPFDPAWLLRAVAQAAADGALRREAGRLRDTATGAAGEVERLEARLHDMQGKAHFAHLAGGLTHELKNLLSIIRISADYGLRRGADTGADAKILKHLRIISDQVDRSQEQIIRFSRLARGEDTAGGPCDASAVVRDLLTLLDYTFGSAGILVQTRLAEDLPPAAAGEAAIRHALLNLLLNARDALPGGGCITVRGATRPPAAPGDAARIVIQVEDNGPGIAPDMLERVFEPFHTTKGDAQGTGLGLSVARRLAQSSGGTLEALPHDGGALFELTIPAADTGAGPDRADAQGRDDATARTQVSQPAPAQTTSGRSHRP